MIKKIAYKHPSDGSIHVLHPAPQADVARFVPEVKDMTEEQFIEWVRAKDVPAGASNVTIMQEQDLPGDRHFRDGWDFSQDGKRVEVNLEKAKVIHLERLRVERNSTLDALDKDLMAAEEQGNAAEANRIKAKKQALRDMPSDIADELAAIQDAETLKNYVPDVLKTEEMKG